MDTYSNHEIQEAVDTAKRNHLDHFLFQNPFGRRRTPEGRTRRSGC